MQDVLEFILKNITTHPDDVVVEIHEDHGITNYTISVNPEDVGRIIGKEGKIIKAIRTIMRVIAIQRNLRVRVSVNSDENRQADEVVIESTPEPESRPETTTESVEVESVDDSLTVEV